MKPIKGILRVFVGAWLLAIPLFLGIMGIAWVAWGATYNFYFNNTEQGNNSTASPKLVVSPGESGVGKENGTGKESGKAELIPPASPAALPTKQPATYPATESESGSVSSSRESLQPWASLSPLQVNLSAMGTTFGVYAVAGPSVGASFDFSRYIGLDISAAYMEVFDSKVSLARADLRLMPLHIPTPYQDGIQLGMLVGAAKFISDSFPSQASAEVGVVLDIPVGRKSGLEFSYRVMKQTFEFVNYQTLSGGLSFRI